MPNYVIVTGGSRGIGFEIAKLLLQNSYSVIYTYLHSNDSFEELLQISKQNGVDCISYKLDVSKSQEVSDFHNWADEKKFELDGIVNNAGISSDSLLINMSDDMWNDVLAVNLSGTFFMCREFSKTLMYQGHGFIINIASSTGLTGSKGASNYAASKGGIIALSKSIGLELARFGIQVNVIAPGFVQTDMISSLSSEKTKGLKKKILLNRFGKPDEVAQLVLFLARGNHFFDNAVLEMDGGRPA